MKTNDGSVRIRKGDLDDPSDRAFITDAWLKGWKKSPFAGVVPNNLFDQVFYESLRQLRDRGMTILILESTEVDSQIGFIAFEEAAVPVLHWVYVKPILRGEGFFQQLLAAAGAPEGQSFLYTYRTPDCRKFKNGTHCPAVARRKDLEPIYAEAPSKRSKIHG